MSNISASITDSQISELIPACRSIDTLLSLVPCFVLDHTKYDDDDKIGLKCTACDVLFKYNYFDDGLRFDNDETLPPTFCHLKGHVKRHIGSSSHLANVEYKAVKAKEEASFLKQSKEVAVNCASAAYLTYKIGTSYQSYENIIAEIYSSGGNVGVKNHSKRFPREFLPSMYTVLKNSFISMLSDNVLPFGLIADKMTAKHRKRHIIGIRIPIWDVNRPMMAHFVNP